MKITDSTSKNIDLVKLDSLFETIGWRRLGSEKWSEILSKTYFVYTLWDSDKLIGMGRIVEDGIMCMFYDIVVHPEYRSKGLGKKIVSRMLDEIKYKDYTTVGLFTWDKNPMLIEFYSKFGFKQVETGMELVKKN